MVSQVKKSSVNTLTIIEPAKSLDQFRGQHKAFRSLVKSDMKEGADYGLIPGTKKRSLWQPGAEKLASFFGLTSKLRLIKEVEKLEDPNSLNFVYYKYRCVLKHFETGKFVGEAERSCNSREAGKANTRKGIYDLINTCQAVAQKRAFVAAVRTATMASDFFSSDISNGTTGPTTKKEDPIRAGQMAKLHAVATPRGFNDDNLHKTIFVRYSKRSKTELTGAEMAELTEDLLSKFKEVGAGNKPERYDSKEEEAKGAAEGFEKQKTEEEAEKALKIDELKKTVKKIENKKEEPKKCAQCKKKKAREDGFCSDKCQDKYYPPKREISFKKGAKLFGKHNAKGRQELTLIELKCGVSVWANLKKEQKCECGATILWSTVDKSKKSMPINSIGKGKWDTHFVSCPLANKKRKKK